MSESGENNFLDIFRAIGKNDYVVYEKDYLDTLKDNPIIKGLWSAGPWFCFVANTFTKKIELVSGESQRVIGYNQDEIIKLNERFIEGMIHPEDFPFVVSVIGQAMGYVVSLPETERSGVYVVFQNRSIRKDSRIIVTQNQNIPLKFDAQNIPYLFANIITDITHLDVKNVPYANIIDRGTGKVFPLNPTHISIQEFEARFTKREIEIIRLLIKGLNSRSISEKLSISYETVRTHKRNILSKAELHSVNELIGYILKNFPSF